MSNIFWLNDARLARLKPFFPKSIASHVLMIDATYLKEHRTATSMGVKKSGAAT